MSLVILKTTSDTLFILLWTNYSTNELLRGNIKNTCGDNRANGVSKLFKSPL